jgi:predicted ribosomally synthesized peptide with SipW-like signal peptide
MRLETTKPHMTRSRKILLSAVIVGILGIIGGAAAFSAFSSSTQTSNTFTAGTVAVGANDAGSALYSLANTKPGDTATSCIKVTYTGTLDSDVRLYAPDTIGALGPYLTLTITPGTQASSTFPSCTGFNADPAGPLYSGTLAAFQTAHSGWNNGMSTYPASATKWVTGDAVVYQFTLTLQDNNAANAGSSPGLTTGAHRFTFEARNK